MRNVEVLKGMLADVCVQFEGLESDAGILSVIRSKELELDAEEADRMREQYSGKSYEEWVDLAHPDVERSVFLPFRDSALLYGRRGVDEERFRVFCRAAFETIVGCEGDKALFGDLTRARSAARYVRRGFELRPEQRAAYGVIAEMRDLPPLAVLTSDAAGDIEKSLDVESGKLAGKFVHIPDLSFFSGFCRDGVLLFNSQHQSYLTGLRDGFREELRKYCSE